MRLDGGGNGQSVHSEIFIFSRHIFHECIAINLSYGKFCSMDIKRLSLVRVTVCELNGVELHSPG